MRVAHTTVSGTPLHRMQARPDSGRDAYDTDPSTSMCRKVEGATSSETMKQTILREKEENMARRPHHDKRRDYRQAYSSSLSVAGLGAWNRDGGIAASECTSIDLCERGMGIRIDKGAVPKGALLSIRFPVPSLQISVPVLGEVRWVNEVSPGEYHAGLMFIS